MGENLVVHIEGSAMQNKGDDCPDLNEDDIDELDDMRASIGGRSMIGITSPHRMRTGDSGGKKSHVRSNTYNQTPFSTGHNAVKSIRLRN